MENFMNSLGQTDTVRMAAVVAGFVAAGAMYGIMKNPAMALLYGLIFAVVNLLILWLLMMVIPAQFWYIVTILFLLSIIYYLFMYRSQY